MFTQDGKHIILGYVHPRALHELSRIPLQGSDGVGQEGTVSMPCSMVYGQVPGPTLISDSVLGVLIFKDG